MCSSGGPIDDGGRHGVGFQPIEERPDAAPPAPWPGERTGPQAVRNHRRKLEPHAGSLAPKAGAGEYFVSRDPRWMWSEVVGPRGISIFKEPHARALRGGARIGRLAVDPCGALHVSRRLQGLWWSLCGADPCLPAVPTPKIARNRTR